MRWGGRFVSVGCASGGIPSIPLNLVMLKGVTVRGFEIGGWGRHRPEELRRGRAEPVRLFREGRLNPHVHAVYPLGARSRRWPPSPTAPAPGKVLIVPDGEEGAHEREHRRAGGAGTVPDGPVPR